MIENHETQRQTGTGGFGVVIVSSIARWGRRRLQLGNLRLGLPLLDKADDARGGLLD
jgi:hypothetical protein